MINTDNIRREWEPAWPGDPREMSWATIQTLCDEVDGMRHKIMEAGWLEASLLANRGAKWSDSQQLHT